MIDFKKIESILNTLDPNNPDDWELSFNQKRAWGSRFIHDKLNLLTHENYSIEKLKDISNRQRVFFNETDHSEEAFKKIFPEAKYDEFISPYDIKLPMSVSKKKIQKVAFQLQEHLPLEYNNICDIVKSIYNDKKDGFDRKNIEFYIGFHARELWTKNVIEEKLAKAIAS